jgi:hypothetical protein
MVTRRKKIPKKKKKSTLRGGAGGILRRTMMPIAHMAKNHMTKSLSSSKVPFSFLKTTPFKTPLFSIKRPPTTPRLPAAEDLSLKDVPKEFWPLQDKFTTNRSTQESHNCYSYILDLLSPAAKKLCEKNYPNENMCRRSQPGNAAGMPAMTKPEDFNCGEVMKRVKADNPKIYDTTLAQGCPAETHYMGATVVAPGEDYHFLRSSDELYTAADGPGLEGLPKWMHKAGYKAPTNVDASGKPIINPKTANLNYNDRLNYKEFCGFQCIPRNPSDKHMMMANNKTDPLDPKNRTNPAYNETSTQFHYLHTPPITDKRKSKEIIDRVKLGQQNLKKWLLQHPNEN